MAAFIPISIDVIGGRSVVRWIERGNAPMTMPSFARLARERLAGARRRITGLDGLLTGQGRDPVGLVMHQSRCGSTLLMQSLAHAGCITPISEARPVSQLLTRSDIPAPDRAILLRGLIRALGPLDGQSRGVPSLIKFTSWNMLFFEIIRAAFPDTPWLFLYREPLEVLASHEPKPARWLTNDGFLASLMGMHRVPALAGLAREERAAALLAAYGQAALAASPAAINLLNYDQLPAAISFDVPARFGVATSAVQRGHIADSSRIYSKDVSRRLVFDRDDERRARSITDRLREADLLYTRPVYDALEQVRVGGSGHG